MAENDQSIEEQLRTAQVGDTIQMRLEKSSLSAEEKDRVAPIFAPTDDFTSQASFQGFAKAAGGEWDLERVRGPKDSPTVEIIVRRIASPI
jgi:hypothetical protein